MILFDPTIELLQPSNWTQNFDLRSHNSYFSLPTGGCLKVQCLCVFSQTRCLNRSSNYWNEKLGASVVCNRVWDFSNNASSDQSNIT
mmetsp:Transcript_25498/g.59741  ORF Transcript_25498/g.59741 Transcript_25498/m.59741 type:complete len:87 (-) Transcript_25498:1185-1445(-)